MSPFTKFLQSIKSFIVTTPGKITLAITGIALVAGRTIVYGKTVGENLLFKSGGNAYGVTFNSETGMPSLQLGSYGCCGGSQCREMSEFECSPDHGWGQNFHPGQSCSEIEECEGVCCLPECKDVPRNWCSLEKGMGPDSVASPCSEAKECEMGCCWLEGKAFEEQKVPCTSAGGQWTKGECIKGFSITMESTSEANLDTFGAIGIPKEEIELVKALMKTFGEGAPESTSKMYIEAHTCKDIVYSTWIGTMKTVTTTCTSGGSCETKTSEGSTIMMPFDEDGHYESSGYVGAANLALVGDVNLESMKIHMDFGIATPADFIGYIRKGSDECLKQEGDKDVEFDMWEE